MNDNVCLCVSSLPCSDSVRLSCYSWGQSPYLCHSHMVHMLETPTNPWDTGGQFYTRAQVKHRGNNSPMSVSNQTDRKQRCHILTQTLICSSKDACVCVCGCVPVLAVLAVVVVSTVTDVSMRGAGLPVTLSLIFTRIQMASIRAAFSIVAWEREERITDCPITHINIIIYQFTNINFQPIHKVEKPSKARELA